jgi:GntR family histidine utilization transcriptional repressor
VTDAPTSHSWRSVREEVLRRIAHEDWRPGDAIPNEADLAAELGCARATVNRALRSLSDDGLLERRRKGGTRIARHPVGKATVRIPIVRMEIEERGARYGYRLLDRRMERAPDALRPRFGPHGEGDLLHVIAIHLADERPYALEDRWIVPETVPDALDQSFEVLGANEWLVRHLPLTRAQSEFFAINATDRETAALGASSGEALIVHRRMTWLAERPITLVEMTFAKGHTLRS